MPDLLANHQVKQLVDMPLDMRISFLEERLAAKTRDLVVLEREQEELLMAIHQVKYDLSLYKQLLARFKSEQSRLTEAERTPMDMLRPPFKGLKMAEIIAQALSSSPIPLTTTELAHLVYETHSDAELERARNSLSTELRSGARSKPPKWLKIGRYAYAPLPHPQSATAKK